MPDDDAAFPLQRHLGMRLALTEPGHATAAVTVTDALRNPNGVLHGAVLFAMADTSMGRATMSVLEEGQRCASIEVHLRFVRPVRDGSVTADTRVLHSGRRVVQLQSEVRDDAGRIVVTATGSFAVLPPS